MGNPLGEDLVRERCLDFLLKSYVGHLGVSINALPAIMPVNYIIVDDSVIFRTWRGSDLSRAAVGSVVAFQVDEYDAVGRLAWSVLVRGVGREVTENMDFVGGRTLLSDLWPSDDQTGQFVVIPMTIVSGRQFVQVL